MRMLRRVLAMVVAALCWAQAGLLMSVRAEEWLATTATERPIAGGR